MKKPLSALIDELTVTNIKIYHLTEKSKEEKNTKKLKALNTYRLELSKALDGSISMKKPLSTLIDELTVTNIKIYHLVDKIISNKHTREDARKAQDLNRYRSELCNFINRELKERENIKI